MTSDSRVQKNCFKQIFIDGWEAFKRAHPRYATVDPVVQKMLGCGDPTNGYAGDLSASDAHRAPSAPHAVLSASDRTAGWADAGGADRYGCGGRAGQAAGRATGLHRRLANGRAIGEV